MGKCIVCIEGAKGNEEILYNPDTCPCLNINCDIYKNCSECVKRHHASEKYPLTACEICYKEGYDKVNPAKYEK